MGAHRIVRLVSDGAASIEATCSCGVTAEAAGLLATRALFVDADSCPLGGL
jgi:hypothetical protein